MVQSKVTLLPAVAAARRMSRRIVAGACAALACGAAAWAHDPSSHEARPQDGRIRVISFNVAGVPVIDRSRPARIAAIGRELGRAGYGIGLFQEAWLDKDAGLLAREGGFPYMARRGGGLLGNGLLIASRWPVKENAHRAFRVKNVPGADSFIERGALGARIETPAGPLDVFVTHLTHEPGEEAVAVRLAQVLELSEFVKDFSGGRPFLLGGDFNFFPGSTEAKVLRGLLGLQDSCLDAQGERCGVTSPDSGRRIDYLFLPDISGVSPRLAFGGTFSHEGETLPYSDHLALEVTLDPAVLRSAARPRPGDEARALDIVACALADEVRRLREEIPPPGHPDFGRYDPNPRLKAFEDILGRLGRSLAAPAASGLPVPATAGKPPQTAAGGDTLSRGSQNALDLGETLRSALK